MATSPFAPSSSKPGYGSIVLDLLPPSTPVLRTVSYQYPLKLVAPDPLPSPSTDSASPSLIHTIFLLTYGGGLVAGDAIHLTISLAPQTRLILLTQGSTKIFKTPRPDLLSVQYMTARLAQHSALVYLPDPVQPFKDSSFTQSQIYELEEGLGSLCVCDWVTSGRKARGEDWDIHVYKSRNEVWSLGQEGKKRLLLRDNLILDKTGCTGMQLAERMDSYAVFGTLIIRGLVFKGLAKFFLDEFEALPRIGGRNWGDTVEVELTPREKWRVGRQQRENNDGLIWSAANVREFVLVKFASREVEGSRHFLRDMITEEGSVLENFGERAVLCMK